MEATFFTLAGVEAELPAHAVTVFLPLVDVTDELGSPEFFPGSHNPAIANALTTGEQPVDPPCSPQLDTGAALVC